MLNLLTDYKFYIAAALLLFSMGGNVKQYISHSKLQGRYISCQNELLAIRAAVSEAAQMAQQQEQVLRLREQDAANAQVESKKRMDIILKEEVKGGCEGAIDYLIDNANRA